MSSAVGCAKHASQEGSRVVIISPEEAQNYEFVGIVEGYSILAGMGRHRGHQNAINEVLDKAAAIGADFVVIIKGKAPTFIADQNVTAEAYKKR